MYSLNSTEKNSTHHNFLKWISWSDFDLVEYQDRGFFGEIYSAYWLSGPLTTWDRDLECFIRNGPIKVALKKFDNSQGLSQNFINKLYEIHRCNYIVDFFGITRDKSFYYLVLEYYEAENLYKFLEESEGQLCWRDVVEIIQLVAGGLKCIHSKKSWHGNLHCGNILIDNNDPLDLRITDVGLNILVNNDQLDSNKIYGVLPFVAPEVLLGHDYTSASDIYSFGVIMWSLASGICPFIDIAHDEKLAYEIIANEKRPTICENNFPKVFTDLMRKCWDNDPKQRPTAAQLFKITGKWVSDLCDNPTLTEISRQFYDADDKKTLELEENNFSRPTIHPKAIYTSRPLNFHGIYST